MNSEENAQGSESTELQKLREENIRLRSLLDAHGIVWPDDHAPHSGAAISSSERRTPQFSLRRK